MSESTTNTLRESQMCVLNALAESLNDYADYSQYRVNHMMDH
jgi:hypothetical protein